MCFARFVWSPSFLRAGMPALQARQLIASTIIALVALLSWCNGASADRPDCKNIPINQNSDPYASAAPRAPNQVIDMTREDFPNSDGNGYCLYSPKDKNREIYGLILYLHGYQPVILGVSEYGAYDPMLQFMAQ